MTTVQSKINLKKMQVSADEACRLMKVLANRDRGFFRKPLKAFKIHLIRYRGFAGILDLDGVIRDAYVGVLSAPPKVRPRPFEIILETPQTPPTFLKECAFVAALKTILTEYRQFIAYAPNL